MLGDKSSRSTIFFFEKFDYLLNLRLMLFLWMFSLVVAWGSGCVTWDYFRVHYSCHSSLFFAFVFFFSKRYLRRYNLRGLSEFVLSALAYPLKRRSVVTLVNSLFDVLEPQSLIFWAGVSPQYPPTFWSLPREFALCHLGGPGQISPIHVWRPRFSLLIEK